MSEFNFGSSYSGGRPRLIGVKKSWDSPWVDFMLGLLWLILMLWLFN
jgi:hypothetical protein